MQEYFDNEKFSDITIKVNGSLDIKAHKVILANGSDWFKACFEGGFKEATGRVLWLYEDDPEAVRDLIKLLYGYSQYIESWKHREELAKSASHITPFIALAIVGEKYRVSEACVRGENSFVSILEYLPDAENHANIFAELVEYVYVDHAEEANDFRSYLVDHFIDNVKGSEDMNESRALFDNIPEFAFDVASAAVLRQKA